MSERREVELVEKPAFDEEGMSRDDRILPHRFVAMLIIRFRNQTCPSSNRLYCDRLGALLGDCHIIRNRGTKRVDGQDRRHTLRSTYDLRGCLDESVLDPSDAKILLFGGAAPRDHKCAFVDDAS